MRLAAGTVLMDRNVPASVRDTADGGYDDSCALNERWHGRGRLSYAVTPRFAPTSTERQLALCGRLLDEHPGVFLQSHVAENRGEVAWAAELFPGSRSYLDVYDRYGLLRERAVYAHCIHLDAQDRRRMAESGTAMAFCPTSNLFLGSGLFDLRAAAESGVRVGLGTDVGGGTSLSMLRTLAEAYKVAQMAEHTLSPIAAFHLATLGGAASLRLDDRIGSLEPGKEADFVVLDLASTPLLARRVARTESLAEKLFALMILGDDRAVHATYVLGRRVHVRGAA
jgi:guanine deaminase